MPTYEYHCTACDRRFERFQQMSDPPVRRCPFCRRGKVKRQLGTGAGIIFKGSGFYSTDYRSSGYRKAATAESQTASGKDGGEKPAAKAESTAPAKPEPPAKALSKTGD